MKTLYILRHAKSSWEEPEKDDVDRALISRGITDAKAVAKRLQNELEKLDLIISSPANRAVHTAIIFCITANIPTKKIQIQTEIYESSESTMLKLIKSIPDEHDNVMLVGHNPTVTYFVNNFLENPLDNIPTSGVVGLTFDTDDWKNISKDKLKSYSFDYPKKG